MTWVLVLLALLLAAPGAQAHEVRPAYLGIHQTGAETYDVLWKVPARRDGLRLALYVELPEGCVNLSPPLGVLAPGRFTERWSVRRRGGLAGGAIRIAGLAETVSDVLARVVRLDGSTQVARLTPSAPSFVVEAAPGKLQLAGAYLRLGIEHILGGIDHLLFILALLLLVNGWRRVVSTVTAFTVAHSLSLAAATLGFVHVPQKPVEAVIALSIVFVAAETVHAREGKPSLTQRWPWIVAFCFGLLHGLGFAGALSEIGLPPNAIPLALLLFNVGVEVGQLLFIAAVFAIAMAARELERRLRLPHPVWAWRTLPYGIGAVAAFWVLHRIAAF